MPRGGKNYLALLALSACEIPPPPPGHDFCPPLGIHFPFFLFISLGWLSLQGGELPPPEKLSQGNFPLSPPPVLRLWPRKLDEDKVKTFVQLSQKYFVSDYVTQDRWKNTVKNYESG